LTRIGSWEIDLNKQTVFWSDEVHQMHETNPDSFIPTVEIGINFYREDFLNCVNQLLTIALLLNSFDFEAVLITTSKTELWVREEMLSFWMEMHPNLW
jgi:hypothetical protein